MYRTNERSKRLNSKARKRKLKKSEPQPIPPVNFDLLANGWTQIKDFPHYYINKEGNVLSTRREGQAYILKPQQNLHGYTQVVIKGLDGKCYNKTIHRLLAEHFIQNPDPKNLTEVNHKDLNKANNSLDNLEWLTPSENIKHYHLSKGFEHHYSKLNIEQIRGARELRKRGLAIKVIANHYKVSYTAMWRVVNYQSYTEVN